MSDLLTNEAVYLPHAGVFATREPAPVTLEDYRRRISTRKSVVARVREMPDQTLSQTFRKLHTSEQNQGPTMLSLANGVWTPGYPSIIDCFGNPGEFYPGEDGNRSFCYAVELGAHHLAATGIIDPRGEETRQMIDHMEDVEFLRSGRYKFPEKANRKDFFNFGGF